jgi:hypothetical protein
LNEYWLFESPNDVPKVAVARSCAKVNNISVKTGLKNLTTLDPFDKDIDPADPMALYSYLIIRNI